MTLDEASDRGHAAAVRVRHLGRVEDRLDGLLFGGVDEPAGVDDDDVRANGGRRPVPRGRQAAFEGVGIRLVLGAAEGLDEEGSARDAPGGALQR
jgi:hypothetical protein